MKNILVTGGAGFIGTNLIKYIKENYKDIEITSIDNYFTGKKENHIKGVRYFECNTWDAEEVLSEYTFDIVFHFGEYSRIVKSFDDIKYVEKTILYGTPIILELCRKWNAKLIYSASSSKFGDNGNNENLSPYSWMKSKMVELIKNYNKWFNLQYEICYFYNVYGPNQIIEGDYATVIGIFEKQWKEGKKCTVVEPGTQSRDFTHIEDIVNGVVLSVFKNKNHEWYLRSGINTNIIDVAKMFGDWEFIPKRRGERFTSEEFETDTESELNWKPLQKLENWIKYIKEKK